MMERPKYVHSGDLMNCPIERGGCGRELRWDNGAFCEECMKRASQRSRKGEGITDNSEQYRRMVDDPRIQEMCKGSRRPDVVWVRRAERSDRIHKIAFPSQNWWQERLAGEIYISVWTPDEELTNIGFKQCDSMTFKGTPEQVYCQAFMWVCFGEMWKDNKWVK